MATPTHTGLKNCPLDIDNVTQVWLWEHKFDLIHIRPLHGALTPEESRTFYKTAYENLAPGEWIEQARTSAHLHLQSLSQEPNADLVIFSYVEFDIQPLSWNEAIPADAKLCH